MIDQQGKDNEATKNSACIYSLATCSVSVPESSLRVTLTTQPERVTIHLEHFSCPIKAIESNITRLYAHQVRTVDLFHSQTRTSMSLTLQRSTWPAIPFTKKSPMNLQWLCVFSGGIGFNSAERVSIRWTIALLLLRLEGLSESSPCPPYTRLSQTNYLQLEVMRPPPTVALCKWVISTFDGLLEQYGVREIMFTFGVGVDTLRYRGVFAIGLGPPAFGALAIA